MHQLWCLDKKPKPHDLMTTTNKSSAVHGMVCEESSQVLSNFAGSVDETVPNTISAFDFAVAPKTIGLHHHSHDTARKDCNTPHVPACVVNDATGLCCDASSLHCDTTTPYCIHNIHNIITTQSGSDTIWTPNMDASVMEYMSQRYDSLRVVAIGSSPNPLITWESLPGPLLHVPAVDIINRWRELKPNASYGESWTSGSYTESRNSSDLPITDSSDFFHSLITKDLLSGFANLLEMDLYFWCVTLVKLYKARGDNLSKALVLSDILSRHAGMLRSFANRGELTAAHVSETTELVNQVSDALDILESTEISRDDSGEVYVNQAGFADFFQHSSTFAGAFGTASAIFKYLSDRNVVFPVVKLLVSGTLFAFGTHIGDPQVFTSENISSATKAVYGYFNRGTVGAFVQVFDSIRRLLSTWIHSDNCSTLSEHLKSVNKAELYYQLGMELLKNQTSFAIETVAIQRVHLAKVRDFLDYCQDYLGAGVHVKHPWKIGDTIISDPTRRLWFRTTWRNLDAFYTIEFGRSIRELPAVFFFEAGSSCGKTTLQNMLNQMLLTRHLNVPPDQVNTFTYPWPSDDAQFANGAKNSMLTVLLNDIGALRPDVVKATGGDPIVKKLLALIDMFPYSPDMAELELKGKIFMAPKIIIASTNCPTLGLSNVYNEPAAVMRRIGDVISVTVAPAFATPLQTLDEKALNRWCLANPGGVPQAWMFRIKKLQADNRTFNVQGKGIKVQETFLPPMNEPPMDTDTFLKWADAKFVAHSAIQTSILETINIPYKFGTVFGEDEGDDDEWHEASQELDDDDGHIVAQSGSDFYTLSRWSHMNTTVDRPWPATGDVYDVTDHNLWFFLLSPLVFVTGVFTTVLAFVRIAYGMNYVRRLLVDRWNDSTCIRAINHVATGCRIVSSYSEKKRKAIEWLDTNKRALAVVTSLVAAGAVATYVLRKRKDSRFDCQVGDETKSGRGGYVVRTSPHDTLSRWSQLGGSSLDRASMYGLTQQSSSTTGSNVVARTGDHYVRVTFECKVSSYGCFAIMVGGREMILNRHSLPQYCKRHSIDPNWDSYTMTVHGVGYNNHGSGNTNLTIDHKNIDGSYIPDRDMAGIVLPAGCRPYRDIKDYFLKAPLALWTQDFSYTKSLMPPGTVLSFGEKIPSGVDLKPCGYVVPSVASRPELMTKPQSAVCPIKPNDKVHDIRAPVLCFQLDTKRTTTLPGQCGSPYFLYERGSNIAAIGGMHLGQLTDNEWKKVIIPIYRKDIDSLFPDRPQISPPTLGETMEEEVETEEQSGTISQKTRTCVYDLQQGGTFFKINLHNSPYLSPDTHYADTTIDYMKKTLDVVVNPLSFKVLGYNNGGGKLKSSFVRSPLSEAIASIGSDGLPDVTSTRKVVNNLNKSTRDDHAIKAIAGVMCHADYDENLGKEFQGAAEAYFDSIMFYDKKGEGCVLKYVHPVSVDVAINGSSFDNEGSIRNHKAMEPIDLKTSAGHPYNVTFPANVEEGTKRVGKYPWFSCEHDVTGRARYRMGPELESSYTELHEMCKKDHDTRPMFSAVFKDEPKEERKDTRLILVGPLCTTILCREHLLTICRTMQLNPFVFGAVVGLDATCVQWDQIRNFICGPGDSEKYTFDGDYKNYDKSLFQEVTEAVKWTIVKICEASGKYDEQQLFVVESILRCLLSPVVDVFGVVYWFRSLNTSGNSLTTQINCIANMLFIWFVWTRRMKREMGANYCEKLSREMFRRLIAAVTYGDDHMLGVAYPDLMNCRIMQQGLKEIGIIYTDASKSLDTTEFTLHEDLTFLGRSMIRDSTGSILCPLEFKRIMKTFHFYRLQAGVQFEQMIADLYRGLLLEIHFHGRGIFDTFYSRLVAVMAEYYELSEATIESLYFVDNKGVSLTYDYFRTWWLEKKDNGFIRDPKYLDSMTPLTDEDRALYQQFCERRSRSIVGANTNVA